MATIEAASRKKNGWLPVLVVLFLISYGLMTMLIVEQGRTIESQRALIHELFKDSTELSAVRKAQQEQAARSEMNASANPSSQSFTNEVQQNATPSTQVPSTQAPNQAPMTQAPVNQAPVNQAPRKQSPSSQAGTQKTSQDQAGKPKSQFPMPAQQGTDITDGARSLITI